MLPSPAALKKKIIVKHKKLPVESEDLAAVVKTDECEFWGVVLLPLIAVIHKIVCISAHFDAMKNLKTDSESP